MKSGFLYVTLAGLVSLVFYIPALLAADDTKAALVERGKYLATAGNCAGCHTASSDAPYEGGVPFHTDFGVVYSTNITPSPDSGIGNWTEADFGNALRKGLRPNGDHLYPVFPYTAYAGLSDRDVRALFAYFSSLPAEESSPPPNDLAFPFNQRPLIWAWKQLFFDEGQFSPDAGQSQEWNRGAYLVEVLGHCSACHSPRNILGAENANQHLWGGTYLDRLPNGELRPWSAVDLTGSAVGLGPWSTEEIISYLKTGVNSYATTFGPMNKVVMHSTRHLVGEDLKAMAVYLKSLPGSDAIETPKPGNAILQSGERLYSIHCATCHLPTGKGDRETGPAMAGNPVVQARDPASLINTILYGPELPTEPLPVQRTRMDPYEHLLTDQEIADLATFMRNAWGNSGSIVTGEDVRLQR